MISAFSTQHKFQSKRDETLLLQTDLSKANTVIPKPIQWNDINLSEEWILEGAAPPAIPKQLEPNTKLQNVTQYSDESNPITIRKKVPEWKLSDSDITIESEHPPLRSLTVDQEAFKEEPIPKANKIHWELALPNVKSPPDLTIDNRPSALNQSRYNASSVYEWNIDGMSEYNILGSLQQMTMAANAYKTQSGTFDKAIAEILIAGDPSHLRDKNAELLHNLKCRKLSEFQSYKTTFFTRLFLRDDANHITWKEKFLAGLLTLLGEKVRNSIKALYDNRIPYDELTYGEIVSFVNKEGLKICQDLKLQKQLKWELRRSKQELGSFCKQFNYDPFKTSISKDCNGECSSRPHKKHYKSKSHRKPFQNFRETSYKKPSRPYKKPNFSKKKEFKAKPKTPFNYREATCHKCGIKGHIAKYCRMNMKLHELGLDEEILSKVASLLIESSDSESSMSGDSDPLQLRYSLQCRVPKITVCYSSATVYSAEFQRLLYATAPLQSTV
ncbi:hypothetical protein KPL70_003914 [Citrus sinensis]|nr:hypothetical protein KPL70_003914 [Citrus sinensis]